MLLYPSLCPTMASTVGTAVPSAAATPVMRHLVVTNQQLHILHTALHDVVEALRVPVTRVLVMCMSVTCVSDVCQ